MVANVKRKRIVTGEAPVEELQRKFSEELTTMMKRAAIKLDCDVEELKYCVSNVGIVEIERMTPQEMIDMGVQDAIKKPRGGL